QGYYQTVVAGMASTGWPALNTEGGTDPISCDPNICAPDVVLNGSAGYTVVTFHFIQTLVNLYDSHAPQRITGYGGQQGTGQTLLQVLSERWTVVARPKDGAVF